MRKLVIGHPNEKQKIAMKCQKKHIGYGGARGGGKSWFVRAKAKMLGFGYAGIRIGIVRRTYPELEANHIRVLVPEITNEELGKYNDKKRRITLINGSVIEFRYFQNEKDLNKAQGNEWDILFIDEATQWTERELKMLQACVRGVNDFPKHIYYTCNPGGIGHAYIKRIFIEKKYKAGENPDDYEFIQAKVSDNADLMAADPDYVALLESLPPKLRQAWLDGDWNTMSGVFFEDFVDDPEHYIDRKWTHVIEPFDIPWSWTIYRSYDFGYSKPFSLGYWAISPDGERGAGRAYRFLEWYGWNGVENEGMKWTPDQQFAYIRKLEDTHPALKGRKILGVADPAIWEASSGTSVADTAMKHRIYFSPGDHARIPGWMQCHYRFQFDENGIPMVYIFKNCEHFIRTIPLQQYDDTKVEDLNSELEDHVADEFRYFCMTHPITPKTKPQPIPQGEDPLNQRVPKKRSVFVTYT